MEPLTLSVVGPSETLSSMLRRSGFACRLEASMTWSQAWQKLSKIARYKAGPDVSQIGTTWLDSFVTAGAVRPFADQEVEEIGGQAVFLPVSWQMVSPPLWKSKI